jgi:hypothetical protein
MVRRKESAMKRNNIHMALCLFAFMVGCAEGMPNQVIQQNPAFSARFVACQGPDYDQWPQQPDLNQCMTAGQGVGNLGCTNHIEVPAPQGHPCYGILSICKQLSQQEIDNRCLENWPGYNVRTVGPNCNKWGLCGTPKPAR